VPHVHPNPAQPCVLSCVCGTPIRCRRHVSLICSGGVSQGDNLQTATFAAGCFWGPELAFQRISGVVRFQHADVHICLTCMVLWLLQYVMLGSPQQDQGVQHAEVIARLHGRAQVATSTGYSQGPSPDVTYEQVCSGNTGHAEVVQVCCFFCGGTLCYYLLWRVCGAVFTAPSVLKADTCQHNRVASHITIVMQVLYNPAEVSYEQLLDQFTSIHNPTQLNRQVKHVSSPRRSTQKTRCEHRL
jgi:peptide-methionine (S)-S-oxide reductase